MKILVLLLALALPALAADCPKNQARTEAALLELEMRARVEGNFGFVRGLNEVLDPASKIVARVRFTDLFTYRDGRWQALAGHETLLGEARR